MVMVYTGEVSEDGTQIEALCDCCRKSVGWITRTEASELSCGSERVMCFDCEGHADEVPQALLPDFPYGQVLVDTGPTVIIWRWDKPGRVSQRRIRVKAWLSCLSSSPYLHGKFYERQETGGEK